MSLVRDLLRDAATDARRDDTWHRLQQEAAARPGSTLVQTPGGGIWMSPIETKLYEAMRAEGLSPTPQYCVEGYFVDFAFPDVRLAVEADGAAYHGGERRTRDKKRDWILRNAGWTVKRFHGKTIYSRAGNCAFVIKREVETARAAARLRAEEVERRRAARRAALLRPFRWMAGLFRRRSAAGTSEGDVKDEPPPSM